MKKIIAILIFLLFPLIALAGEGYFLTEMIEIEKEYRYKVIVDYNEVPILDENGQPTGATEFVPIYEEKIDKWKVKKPDIDEELRDWKKVKTHGDKSIIHIVEQNVKKWKRLEKKAEYLGKDPKEIVEKALKSKKVENINIAKDVLYILANYGTEKEQVIVRKTMAEWIIAGKPDPLDEWTPDFVYNGMPYPEMPTAQQITELEVL